MSLARRVVRIGAALVGCGVLALASGSAAGASGATAAAAAQASALGGRIPVVSVSMSDAGGFSLPGTVHSGLVTFRVSSPEASYHALQGFRLNPGFTVDDIIHDLTLGVLGETGADNALGHQLLLQQAVLVGGVVTAPDGPISITIQLEQGTYYFFDLNDLFLGVTPRVHRLEARGAEVSGGLPKFDAAIVATMSGADDLPIFQNVPATLRHDGTFFFLNASDELHEAVFRPTRDGITDQYITDFYDAVISGGPRPESPWIGAQRGLQALSPNRWAVVHIELNTGPNALICYVPSDEAGPPQNGLPHGYIGMHNMLDLT
jgi:hypothetical protein